MEKIIIFLFLFSIGYTYSPCYDSLYLELQNKPISQMDDREYEYFIIKERACIEVDRKKESREIKASIVLMEISVIIIAASSLIVFFLRK